MILRVGIPDLPRAAVSLHVDRWLVAEGNRIAFGDPIVRLVIDVRAVFPHITDAAAIVSLSTGRFSRAAVGQTEHKPDDARIELIASDSGWLRRRLVEVGDKVERSDVLALVTTIADEPVDDELASILPFRSSAQLLDDAEDFS